MAKSYLRYLYLLCIAVYSYPAIANTGTDTLRLKVVRIFQGEIGVKEKTGKNDGARVEEYLAICGLRKGNPYCAAYPSWVFVQAGVKAIISAYAPNWFPKNKTIYTRGAKSNKTPLPADVIGIWIKDKGRIGHVGFNEVWETNTAFCTTVEANTSLSTSGGKADYDGQGVERKRRLKSQIYKISRWL